MRRPAAADDNHHNTGNHDGAGTDGTVADDPGRAGHHNHYDHQLADAVAFTVS